MKYSINKQYENLDFSKKETNFIFCSSIKSNLIICPERETSNIYHKVQMITAVFVK